MPEPFLARDLRVTPIDAFIDPVPRSTGRSSRMATATTRGAGHGAVLATPDTVAIMKTRYGEDCAGPFQELPYGEPLQVGERHHHASTPPATSSARRRC